MHTKALETPITSRFRPQNCTSRDKRPRAQTLYPIRTHITAIQSLIKPISTTTTTTTQVPEGPSQRDARQWPRWQWHGSRSIRGRRRWRGAGRARDRRHTPSDRARERRAARPQRGGIRPSSSGRTRHRCPGPRSADLSTPFDHLACTGQRYRTNAAGVQPRCLEPGYQLSRAERRLLQGNADLLSA